MDVVFGPNALSCSKDYRRSRHFRADLAGSPSDAPSVAVNPLAIGALADDGALDFLVFDDAALLGIDQEHAAG